LQTLQERRDVLRLGNYQTGGRASSESGKAKVWMEFEVAEKERAANAIECLLGQVDLWEIRAR
jgi:hypothetical protein